MAFKLGKKVDFYAWDTYLYTVVSMTFTQGHGRSAEELIQLYYDACASLRDVTSDETMFPFY